MTPLPGLAASFSSFNHTHITSAYTSQLAALFIPYTALIVSASIFQEMDLQYLRTGINSINLRDRGALFTISTHPTPSLIPPLITLRSQRGKRETDHRVIIKRRRFSRRQQNRRISTRDDTRTPRIQPPVIVPRLKVFWDGKAAFFYYLCCGELWGGCDDGRCGVEGCGGRFGGYAAHRLACG